MPFPTIPVRNLNSSAVPKFSSTLPQGSNGGLQYNKLASNVPGNISSDGQYQKAQVQSPKGGASVIAWIPIGSSDTGRVSHKDLADKKGK